MLTTSHHLTITFAEIATAVRLPAVTIDKVRQSDMSHIYDSWCNQSSDKGHLWGLGTGKLEGVSPKPSRGADPMGGRRGERRASRQHLTAEKRKQQSSHGDTLLALLRSSLKQPEEHGQDSNCKYQRTVRGSVQKSTAAATFHGAARKKWLQN